MSTRAVYTFNGKASEFSDSDAEHHVYKHYDGYPSGAAKFIAKSIYFAWDLPRFEPSDFSAAFIAANKGKGGGDVSLTSHYKNHGDIDFRYEITMKGNEIYVTAYAMDNDCDTSISKNIFSGTLSEFLVRAETIEREL